MPSVLTLRLATLADLAAVDMLLARSYPRLLAADYPPSLRVMAVPRLARAQPGLLGSGRYWLACDAAGGILGAGGWSTSGPGRAEIRHVATDPAATRRGIGRAVLGQVMAQAGGQGATAFDCLSTRTAVPFYAALGFRALGEVEIALAPGISFPAVRMVRNR
jgi:GNAT superfamily N-acetyltransferase